MKTMPFFLLCMALMAAGGGCAGNAVAPPSENTVVIFHNGTGPMCIAALAWLDTMRSEHTDLAIEERLTTDLDDLALLGQLTLQYGQSQGVSTTFGYLPIIFFKGQAFSGFNDEIQQSLEGLIDSMKTPSS